MADEAFLLGPPDWFKPEWVKPHQRESLALFTRYRRNAPRGLVPNGRTVQGVYCMMPDGTHLAGFFAWQQKDRAQQIIQQGWDNYQAIAKQRNLTPQRIPDNKPDFTGGKDVARGGIKLQVTARDLPRGNDTRPGNHEGERCAFNINWFDLSPSDAITFVTTSTEATPVPASITHRLAVHTLRDNVRGQVGDWKNQDVKIANLFTQKSGQEGDLISCTITGKVNLSQGNRSYVSELRGKVIFNQRTNTFTAFELIAVGQRTGRTQFNGRQNDLGPAPLGIALVMHNTEKRK